MTRTPVFPQSPSRQKDTLTALGTAGISTAELETISLAARGRAIDHDAPTGRDEGIAPLASLQGFWHLAQVRLGKNGASQCREKEEMHF